MPTPPSPTVLHYVGSDRDQGGVLAVVRAFAEEGFFSCVLGVNEGFRQTGRPELPCVEFSVIGPDINPLAVWRARAVARQVRAWLQESRQRIFHAHSRSGLLVALWLRSWGEARVVATVHWLGRQRWFYRRAARRLGSDLLWLTPSMKSYYGLDGAGWGDCVPPCISIAKWRNASPRSREPVGVVRFAAVGTLVPVKQWELLVRAVGRVDRKISLRVIHAGGENGTIESARYAQALRELAREAGAEARIEWRGEVRDMRAFYQEVDCVVIASRFEAFSLAVLEAAAAGVPTLASDAAGVRDVLEACNLGWCFAADSVEALAARMTELAGTGAIQKWKRSEEALRDFTSAAVAAKQREIYRARLDRCA